MSNPAMTDITFHFNVPDRLLYCCRLLRKALRAGTPGVAVCGPAPTLTRLDRMLWTFDPQEFLPHVMVRAGEGATPRLQRTPVWLVEKAEDGARSPVLLHLGDEPATGFDSYGRLIEVVSTEPGEREAARRRWKHYASRGYSVRGHEAAGAAS
jgi:DNA polymerase-3 subunit chi